MPARALLFAAAASLVLSGCLWIWPLKNDPPIDPPDDDVLSFCVPRPREDGPVLVGGPEEVRDIRCRIRFARSATWTLSGVDLEPPLDDGPLVGRELLLGRDVERIELHRDFLPWSPRPYRLDLTLEVVTEAGGRQAEIWPLMVVPDAGQLTSDAPSLLLPFDEPEAPPEEPE